MAYQSYNVPISIKGIVFEDGKVWLRYNQRGEWELPGGKMDKGEQPEETCAREIEEELGFKVKVGVITQAYMHVIESSEDESNGVLIISFVCKILKKVGGFETVGEAGEARFRQFSIAEIESLNMPAFYKDAIQKGMPSTTSNLDRS